MASFILPVLPVTPTKPLDNRLILSNISRCEQTTSIRTQTPSKRRRYTPPKLATSAPVKEDVRKSLNNLLTKTPTVSPETKTGNRKQRQGNGWGKYKVLLFNDEDHSKDMVVGILKKCVPELNDAQARNVMEMAHRTGMGVVGVWVLEISEAYCDLLRNNGLRCDVEEE